MFGYLGLLVKQGPQRWVHDELEAVSRLMFTYAESEPALEFVRRLSMSMQQRLSPAETLSGDFCFGEWAPQLIADLLATLTPERALIFQSVREPDDSSAVGGEEKTAPLTAPLKSAEEVAVGTDGLPAFRPSKRPQKVGCMCKPGEVCGEHLTSSGAQLTSSGVPGRGDASEGWEEEPWFSTSFLREPVPPERLARWRAAHDRAGEAEVALSLPAPNVYIPSDFSLRHVHSSPTSLDGKSSYLPPPSIGHSSPALLNGQDEVVTAASGSKTTLAPVGRHHPEVALSSPTGFLFYCPSERFASPKACYCLELACDRGDPSPEHEVLAMLVGQVVGELLNEESYAALMAGLSLEVNVTKRGATHHSPPIFRDHMYLIAERICSQRRWSCAHIYS